MENRTVDPQPTSNVLVCFALAAERRFFTVHPSFGGRLRIRITGMGQGNALASIQQALAETMPRSVLTCGIAGGLNPELSVGTIVFDADRNYPDAGDLPKLGARPGTFHCANHVIIHAVEKRGLWESTQADAVEMESRVIRQHCLERGVPSATLRAISDTAAEDLPLDFNALMTRDCRLDYGKLARAVLRSPGRIPGLLRLRRNTNQAARSLGRFLDQLVQRKMG